MNIYILYFVLLFVVSISILIDYLSIKIKKNAIQTVEDMGIGWTLANSFECYNPNVKIMLNPDEQLKLCGNVVPTKELINQLCYLGFDRMSIQAFRTKIIAKLRDSEVIISSSPNGYKIPSSEEELEDFINHGIMIILPMLSRLKKCNDIIKMGTSGSIDLFQRAEYQVLANMFKEEN